MSLGPKKNSYNVMDSTILPSSSFQIKYCNCFDHFTISTGGRGISLQGAIRKKPNAFVMVYHMKLVHKMGRDATQEAGV